MVSKKRLTVVKKLGKSKYTTCSVIDSCDGQCIDCEHLDQMVKKLSKIEDGLESGKITIFPFKVGDLVYWAWGLTTKFKVLEGKIIEIGLDENSKIWFSVKYDLGFTHRHTIDEYWDKTVFSVKSKAEAKLEELKEG